MYNVCNFLTTGHEITMPIGMPLKSINQPKDLYFHFIYLTWNGKL